MKKNLLIKLIILGFIISFLSCKKEIETVELESIFIKKMPNKTSFFCGEILDFEGLEIVGVYTDGSIKIINDYTTEPKNGDLITNNKKIEIKVFYGQKECSFPLIISESNFDSPVIVAQPESQTVLIGNEIELIVTVEEPNEGVITYQWYESVDNKNYSEISGANTQILKICANEKSTKYYYVKVIHSFSEENEKSRAINPAYKKAVAINSDIVSVKFIEPMKNVNNFNATQNVTGEIILSWDDVISDTVNYYELSINHSALMINDKSGKGCKDCYNI